MTEYKYDVDTITDECYMLKTPLSIGNLKILLNSGWLLCNSPYTDQVVMLNTDQITKHCGGKA